MELKFGAQLPITSNLKLQTSNSLQTPNSFQTFLRGFIFLMNKLETTINQFQSIDDEFRLDLLLDYAEKLPPLPEKYQAAKDAGLNRVHECQTPVYLWVEVAEGKLKLFADVADEAPTVRGFVSILVNSLTGSSAADVEDIPNDLLSQLGIGRQVGMIRIQGLSAILQRIKAGVRKAVEAGSS